MNLRKPHILIISVIVSFIFFIALSYFFTGISNYISGKLQPNYITPTQKDSAYMDLLMNPIKRDTVMDLSNALRPFYIVSDSMKTILDAEISPQLISEILIEKGLALELRNELKKMDDQDIIQCPNCLEDTFHQESKWIEYIQSTPPKEVKSYIDQKIILVEKAEHQRLMEYQ